MMEWMGNILINQEKVIKAVPKKLQEINAEHIDKGHEERTEFPINSYVLCSYPESAIGSKPPTKLHPILMGPFRVVNFVGSKYTIQNVLDHKLKTVHISRLREFHMDENTSSVENIASRDTQEYHVERILQHKGDLKRKRTLEFLVKWSGYDESHNSWEPWNNLKSTSKLHEYLISIGAADKVPENYKENYPNEIFNTKHKRNNNNSYNIKSVNS